MVTNFPRKFVYTHCNEYSAKSNLNSFDFAQADKIGLLKRFFAFQHSIVIISNTTAKTATAAKTHLINHAKHEPNITPATNINSAARIAVIMRKHLRAPHADSGLFHPYT